MAKAPQAVPQAVNKAVTETTQAAQSWFETIKNKIQSFLESLKLNHQTIIEYAAYFGVAFFSGFIFKKYARGFLLYALIFGGLMFGLHYFGIIAIDWAKLKEFIGMVPTDDTFSMDPYMQWAKSHITQLIIGIIGFIIGYLVG